MKVRLLTCIITVFLIFFSVKSYSQNENETPISMGEQRKPIYIGPVLGYNKVYNNVTLLTFQDPTNLCKPFVNGSGNGFYAGLSFEYLFGNPEKSISSIIGRVLFNSMPSYMESLQDNYPTLVAGPGPNTNHIIWTTTKHEANITYNMLTAEVCYKLNPIPNINLGITAGPTFDFPITKKINQTYKLIGDPLNAQFVVDPTKPYTYTDNNRTIIIQNGALPNASGFRLGLKIGVQYEIITARRMYIVPAIYYNLGVTNVTSTDNWKINALQMGVDVRFAL